MTKNPESLTLEIKHVSEQLRRLEQRLKSEAAPDPVALNEFRQTVDNVRLTAWSTSELMNAKYANKNPDTVMAFLAAERLRRFDQMVRSLCGDIERRAITFQTNGMESLLCSLETLQGRVRQCLRGTEACSELNLR
jgi:DNA-binding transcriptional regulator YbjK